MAATRSSPDGRPLQRHADRDHVTGAAVPVVRSLAELSSLTAHLAASSAESGLGVEPTAIRPGHLSARMPLTARGRTSDGRLSPYALAVFADCGIGVAVNSALPESDTGPTVELTITMVGEPHPDAGLLWLEAEVVTVSPVSGIGRCEIRDDTGAVIAHAVGLMATDPGRAGPTEVPATRHFDPRVVTVEAVDGDFARAKVGVDDRMVNTRGVIHGGVLTGAVMTAQQSFLADRRWRNLTTNVHFLRPVAVKDGHVVCQSEYLHRGRRFRTVRTSVFRADGRVAVEVIGTSVIDEGEVG